MDDKIQGVVLQSIRYGDTSLIVKVFTRNHGLRSYMVKGALKHGSRNSVALFQNMHFIQYIETGEPNKGSLRYLKDVQLVWVYQSIPSLMKKNAILMFVSELLSKTLTEEAQNTALYDFIFGSMQWLDLVDQGYGNFPLFFTLELTRHLGFYPKDNFQEGWCFDMMEGLFVHDYPLHPYYMDAQGAARLAAMLDLGVDETCRMPLNATTRREMLDGLMTFMRLHAPILNEFHSHEVLKTVLE